MSLAKTRRAERLAKKHEAKLSDLAGMLSKIVGIEVEVTIRGLNEFTISAEGDMSVRFNELATFVASYCRTSFRFDAECDMSFMYCEKIE